MSNKVYIHGNKETVVTRKPNEDDEWDRGDTCAHWDITHANTNPRNAISEIETNHTGKVYILYVIYSTGDSFGHDENNCFEPIWVFKDRDLMLKAKEIIEQNDTNPIDLDVGKDRPLSLSASWQGYFERLEDVNFIETFI